MRSRMNSEVARIGLVAGVALSLGCLLMASPAASAAQPTRSTTMAQCMATESAATDYGCYEISVASIGPAKVVLRITWDLNTTAEGFNNADWKGGVWMQRWPVAGQWPKGGYPKGVEQLPSGKGQELCESSIAAGSAASNCYRTFSGAKGSLDLDFPASMAGYVYEIQTSDTICSTDRSSCGPSGGSLQNSSYAYAFVIKSFKYKNKKGKNMIGTTCPAAAKRASSCTATLSARLVNNIGGGSPVALSSGS
jgi:hypothetical protein